MRDQSERGDGRRRVKPHSVYWGRRAVQWALAITVLAIGVQFTLWVRPHLEGSWPSVSRPAGVEGFLPINSLMALRQLVTHGVVDAVHPAGLAIFLAACLMSWALPRAFCSHICPVGLVSELLGRAGTWITGRVIRPPRWLDIPLRGVKWLLLAFFVWAIYISMSGEQVAGFLDGDYASVADVKMWLFFARPSRTTLVVLGALLIGSLFVRDLWCRYLCPYGALLGLFGRVAPLKITRDPDVCTSCEGCTEVCPSHLRVHKMIRVGSVECTGCLDCVVACPVSACLEVRPPKRRGVGRRVRPLAAVGIALLIWLAVIGGFRLAGWWHTSISPEEYNRRLQRIDSPEYAHPGSG